MDEIRRWFEAHKKLCVLTGIFGLLVSPFLWPFFLAAIVQSLTLALPIAAGIFFYRELNEKKEKQDEEKQERNQQDQRSDTGAEPSHMQEADDIPEGRTEKEPEPVKKEEGRGAAAPRPQEALAVFWYRNEGRRAVLNLRRKLEQEGCSEFSVNREGICSVRGEKGYRRVGVLRGYPTGESRVVMQELKKDGYFACAGGTYLWIGWKKGAGK